MASRGTKVYVKELDIVAEVYATKGNQITHVVDNSGKIIEVIDKTITVLSILRKLWLIIRGFFFISVFCVLCIGDVAAQNVQFRQLPRTPQKFHIVSAYDSINPTNFALKYIGLADLLDSLNITSGGGGDTSKWVLSGNNIYNKNSGNVGIGVTSPTFKLDVSGDAQINGIRYGRAGNAGVNNIAIGNNFTLAAKTTGGSNIGIGLNALQSVTTGLNNVAIGQNAGNLFTGNNLVALGNEAFQNGTGGDNIAIGAGAMRNYTSVSSCAIGFRALENGTGSGNFAMGADAMRNYTGSASVAIGASNPLREGSGIQNTAIGSQAMSNSGRTAGSFNTAIGARAILNSTTCGSNTAVGDAALSGATTGSDNTALGRQTFFTGNVNRGIALGFRAGYYETANDRLHISNQQGTNEATGRERAIIYGVMNATTANQILDLNAKVKATYRPNAAVAIPSIDADGYFGANVTIGTGLDLTGGTITSTVVNTDNQTLSISGSDLSISGGNTVTLPSGGTVTSVGLTTGTTGTDVNVTGSPITTSGTFTLNIPTASATNRGVLSTTDWTNFNAKPNGSGAFNKVAFWSGTNTLTSKTEFHWDNTNNRLGIGTSTPAANIHTTGTLRVDNRTPAQPGTVAGWTTNGDAATVTIGSGLQLSFGTLSSTVVNTDNQTLSISGNNLSISNGNTVTLPSGGITGSGTATQVAYWSGTSSITGNNNLWWNNSAISLGIGTSSPQRNLHVQGTARITGSTGNASEVIGRNGAGDISGLVTGANVFVGGGLIQGETWFAQRNTNGSTSQSIGTSYSKLTIGSSGADFDQIGSGITANPSGSGNDNTILVGTSGVYEVSFCTCYGGTGDIPSYLNFQLFSAQNGNTSAATVTRWYMRSAHTGSIPLCISRTIILSLTGNRYYSIRASTDTGSDTYTFYNNVLTIKRIS
jgi:hypothetical protein